MIGNKKKIMAALVIASMLTCLTACGESVPDLTQEQETEISEYAVELITKYQKGDNSRLQLIEEQKDADVEEPGDTESVLEEENSQTENEVSGEETPGESDSMQGEESDAEQDISSWDNKQTEETGEDSEQPVYSNQTLDQILGLQNVSVTYKGYEVMETYETGENSYFSLTATRGKKFVVLRFTIENQSDTTQKIDMNTYDVKYSFGDAEGKKKKLEHTMTAKDIYSYVGYLEPGQTDTLIGLAEMVESDISDIQKPVLKVQYMDWNEVLLLQ